MKLIRRTILAVVLLIVIVVVVVFFRLDHIVKNTVESQATDSLKLQTTLNSASLSLFGGKLNLNDLQIASPGGYSAPHMLELADTDVAVHYGQLRKDPVHIESLTLTKPKLIIEQHNGVFNFKRAMEQIPPSESASSQKQPMKLVVDDLTVKDAQVVIRPGVELPGMPQEIPVTVPSLTMRNVGTGDGSQNGAAVKDVVMQVITALAGSASESNAIPDQLKALLHVSVGSVVGQLGSEAQKRVAAAIPGAFGKTLSGALQDPQALLKDPAKALQGVGSLLGGNKTGTDTTKPNDVKDKAIDAVKGLFDQKQKKKEDAR